MLYQVGARVRATASYVPETVVTDADLGGGNQLARSLRRLLGTESRRMAREGESCGDLIAEAGRRALATAELSALDLDRIVVSATPGDFLEPPTASVVQYKLQAKCPALDIKMSCVGWLAGVDYALRCIATGDRRVLVLGGTVVSYGSPFLLVQHRAIFGDGAAGVLIEADDRRSFLAGGLWTDGRHYPMITLPHNGSPPTPGAPAQFRGKFHMGRRDVFFRCLKDDMVPLVEDTLRQAGVAKDSIDVAIVHQPSQKLFEAAVEYLGLRSDQVICDFYKYGNTISAELPIALDEAVRGGRIKRGDTVLMVTFGAGFNLGAMVMTY